MPQSHRGGNAVTFQPQGMAMNFAPQRNQYYEGAEYDMMYENTPQIPSSKKFYQDEFDQIQPYVAKQWNVREERSGNDRLENAGTAGSFDLQPRLFPEIRRIGRQNRAHLLETALRNANPMIENVGGGTPYKKMKLNSATDPLVVSKVAPYESNILA